MRTLVQIVIFAAVIALLVASAFLYFGVSEIRGFNEADQGTTSAPSANQAAAQAAADKMFHEGFLKEMRGQCIATALATAAKQGRSGPAVEDEMTLRCDCAVELAAPLSREEKFGLSNDREAQSRFMAEVARRCVR